jgi:nitrogen regulatory protein PII
MKLVTVVAESAVEHRLTEELLALGAAGFTVVEGRGAGTRHARPSDLPGSNVRIETVVPEAVAERILDRLCEHWFADYSLVAYVSDVAVVRTRKYEAQQLPPAPGAARVAR